MATGGTTQTLSSGLSFASLTNLPNNLIFFDTDGTPYVNAAGTTALTSTAVIPITSGSSTANIQILPQTGYGALS